MTMLKKLGLSVAIALFAVTSTLSTAQAAPAKQDKTVKVQQIKKVKQITGVRAPRNGGSLRAAGLGPGAVVGLVFAGVLTLAIANDINDDEPCVSGCR